MADALTEAHKAHAAAQHDLAGSATAFLSEASLPAVRALNGAEAPTLLPGVAPDCERCPAGAHQP